MSYRAPIQEQLFVLETVADLAALAELPRFESGTPDVAAAILDESRKLAENVFAPLNSIGDIQGARWSAHGVTLPAGFDEAYNHYVNGSWGALTADVAFGGQRLPFVLGCAVQEQLSSANMAFSLCMMLTQAAIEALSVHGSEDLKRTYLANLVSGVWTGTMNLTEPQAGSDVGALRTRAERTSDGSYRIMGTKIFITWGEHGLAGNIIHLVLARLPDGPAGSRGISLFLVPKILSDGTHNDVQCTSIEHKLGIHASPTCTMAFGENGRCVGYLVGEEHAGMRAMFTMMNHARINVGLQGVAIAERAYQAAVAYARDRVQSVPIEGDGRAAPIVNHPDVRRMLMTMRALTQAARSLTYFTAAQVDRSHAEKNEDARTFARGLADLLTPVVKAWSTDIGVEVANLAIQVFGGAGYIEEAGVAQHLRDARIAPIYEGTNGIQALDLVARKLRIENGAILRRLLNEIAAFCSEPVEASCIHERLGAAVAVLEAASDAVLRHSAVGQAAAAGPYLKIFALVTSAWLLAKQATAASERLAPGCGNESFLRTKIATAEFFVQQILPQVDGLLPAVSSDATALLSADSDW